jgi:hypothetical protein
LADRGVSCLDPAITFAQLPIAWDHGPVEDDSVFHLGLAIVSLLTSIADLTRRRIPTRRAILAPTAVVIVGLVAKP